MTKKEYITVKIEKCLYKQVRSKISAKSFNKCLKGMLITCGDYGAPETDTELAHLFNQLRFSIKPLADRITALEEK